MKSCYNLATYDIFGIIGSAENSCWFAFCPQIDMILWTGADFGSFYPQKELLLWTEWHKAGGAVPRNLIYQYRCYIKPHDLCSNGYYFA